MKDKPNLHRKNKVNVNSHEDSASELLCRVCLFNEVVRIDEQGNKALINY